ncbi:hypothetical protein TCDM_12236 [Trypanosoma cruzi Dm28c]|uniref:Uncharacterized protein n=1 Tax=Trypanosoma cruzi Dm28c TaxID=1416333 RepID=V5B5A7_TRYCR|nr:hypothetical protein TCDM_12236 [Trypanosoma cruzi Dm28c]
MPSARKVLIIVQWEERAAGASWRRNPLNAPPGSRAMPRKASWMANPSAYGVKDPSVSQSPGASEHKACRQRRRLQHVQRGQCDGGAGLPAYHGRAQTQSQEYRSSADPREQGRGASMPRGITGLGSRGHQALSHGPQAAWRSYGRGHDCGTPVCGHLQLVAGSLLVRLCEHCMPPLQHTRPAPL